MKSRHCYNVVFMVCFTQTAKKNGLVCFFALDVPLKTADLIECSSMYKESSLSIKKNQKSQGSWLSGKASVFGPLFLPGRIMRYKRLLPEFLEPPKKKRPSSEGLNLESPTIATSRPSPPEAACSTEEPFCQQVLPDV